MMCTLFCIKDASRIVYFRQRISFLKLCILDHSRPIWETIREKYMYIVIFLFCNRGCIPLPRARCVLRYFLVVRTWVFSIIPVQLSVHRSSLVLYMVLLTKVDNRQRVMPKMNKLYSAHLADKRFCTKILFTIKHKHKLILPKADKILP